MKDEKYKVTVKMAVIYELDLEVMATSSEEAKFKADMVAQGNCDLGTMVYSGDREFTVTKSE